MDKCPKCGSPEELGMIQDWSCGSIEEEDESVTESETCLRRQLAAANERAGRLEKALRDAIEHVAGSRIGHYGDHTAHCDITVRPERLTAWVKALEVPDAS